MLWAILFVAAIPLLPLQATNLAAFKAVMAMLGSLVGGAFAGYYFLSIERDYLREAIVTAVTWIVVNWLLDVVALLPFTHQTLPQYFMEIGIEYLGMFGPVIAIGYLLEKKAAGKPGVYS
ncbi:MAG: hypothetical protein HY852_23510 [Bradyrhizobium sp.]|uniref:hypothetical protein n=1 Tax=Bradyrhizobium sp. TaxID=376 RepID=UPI0025BD81FA|nr:hypothetical protein [Bradyrhizobium sp.]MBI5264774.1 hypothetical protein [Bradyrhizobium sp.]